MIKQLETFFEQPDGTTYRAARRSLLRNASFAPRGEQLLELAGFVERQAVQQGQRFADAMLPAWSLSPSYHWLCARLAEQQQDEEARELARFMMSSCLQGLLATGSGTRQRPYLVTYVSDEEDILQTLRLQPVTQRLIEGRRGPLDVVSCREAADVYFDVAELLEHLPGQRMPSSLKLAVR
jgi:hypothetical protein